MSSKKLTVKQVNDLIALDNLLDELSESGLLDKLASFDCYDTVTRFLALVGDVRTNETAI